jgi:hypothetical protein
MFVAGIEGRGGIAPGSAEADRTLRAMVNAINDGRIREFAAFDREGFRISFV